MSKSMEIKQKKSSKTFWWRCSHPSVIVETLSRARAIENTNPLVNQAFALARRLKQRHKSRFPIVEELFLGLVALVEQCEAMQRYLSYPFDSLGNEILTQGKALISDFKTEGVAEGVGLDMALILIKLDRFFQFLSEEYYQGRQKKPVCLVIEENLTSIYCQHQTPLLRKIQKRSTDENDCGKRALDV